MISKSMSNRSRNNMSSSPSSKHDNDNDTDSDTVNLFCLATSCLASSMAASEPIRRVAFEAASFLSSSSSSSSSSLLMSLSIHEDLDSPSSCSSIVSRSKIDGTVVTDADGAAQKIIVDAIRSINPRIRIVREESDEEENRLSKHGSGCVQITTLTAGEENGSNRSLTVEQAMEHDDDDDDDDNAVKKVRTKTPVNITLDLNSWVSIYSYARQQIQTCVEIKQFLLQQGDVDPKRVSVFGKIC